MEDRDITIVTQVAFKAATDLAVADQMALDTPEGQAKFEEVFSHLTESLFGAIESQRQMSQAQVIQGHFPGSTVVEQPQVQPMASAYPQQPVNGGAPSPLRVKGNQFGPLPDWLYAEAAAKGVNEVYDNRDRVGGTKRPWFKATTGGDNAAAFWPPRG